MISSLLNGILSYTADHLSPLVPKVGLCIALPLQFFGNHSILTEDVLKVSFFQMHSGVSCSDEDEKPRKRRRTSSSSSSPVMLKEVTKVTPSVSKNITVPVSSPKMSNIMQSIANSLPPHLSPVKITFTKPAIQTTNATTQKVRELLYVTSLLNLLTLSSYFFICLLIR